MKVDLLASRPHYLDHLGPVWDALPENMRGTSYTDGLPVGDTPVLVGSWNDLETANRRRRPAILFEHGAGQTYSNDHPGYAGGTGRDNVILFMAPSQRVALRNAERYPQTAAAVVGSPRVDELRKIKRTGGPVTVAISFHWRCKVARESGTALDHYRHVLGQLHEDLAYHSVRLIGHGHPRAWEELEPLYADLGIMPVARFADVVSRADVYVCDNSSTIFEFAALGRPVVLLNSPHYRRSANHGLRFWTEADVGIQVSRPEDLLSSIMVALADPPEMVVQRRRATERVYAHTDGSATTRAVAAIAAVIHQGSTSIDSMYRVALPQPRRSAMANEDQDPEARSGSTLVHANVAFYSGLKAGRKGWVPNEIADVAIKNGYAVRVDKLASRLALEAPAGSEPTGAVDQADLAAMAAEMQGMAAQSQGVSNSGETEPPADDGAAQVGEATDQERVGLNVPLGSTGELYTNPDGSTGARIVEGS